MAQPSTASLLFDLARTMLPVLAAREWNAIYAETSAVYAETPAVYLEAPAVYAETRAVFYRAWFARCVQAQTRLSAAVCRALADDLLPPTRPPSEAEPLAALPSDDCDPRLLGWLHETLLVYRLTGEPPTLRLVPTAGDRRAQGSYYTPEALARWIVRHTVGPALDDHLNSLSQRWLNLAQPNPDDLFTFAVLDPAAGTGYFLLEALTLITDRMLAFLHDFPDHPLHADATGVRGAVLANCLYGVDLDPQAAGLARMALWLAAGDAQASAGNLVAHVIQGNALTARLPRAAGFDAVIGNPPYVPWRAIGAYRGPLESGSFRGCAYHARPNHADAQPNLYLFFMVLMLDLLRPGGYGGFVLPPEWLTDRRAAAFTAHLADQITRGALLLFDPTLHLFDQVSRPVGTASLLFGVQKRNPADASHCHAADRLDAFTLAGTDRAAALAALDTLDLWQLARVNARGTFRQVALTNTRREAGRAGATLPDWLTEPTVPLITTGDRDWFEIGGGFQPPMALVPCYTLDEAAYRRLPPAEQRFVFPALVQARSITRYDVRGEERYWIVLNTLASAAEAEYAAPTLWAQLSQHWQTLEAALGANWWRFPNPRNLTTLASRIPRLLTPRTAARNSFALDTTGYLFKGTNAYLCVRSPYDPAYMLALLNSRLLDQYYGVAGQTYHGSARKYEPGKITHFPIRRIDFTTPAAARAQVAASAWGDLQRAGWTDDTLLRLAESHLAAGRADVVHDMIAALAHMMSDQCAQGANERAASHNHPVAALDYMLDHLVYLLYGLTEAQIAQIEAARP